MKRNCMCLKCQKETSHYYFMMMPVGVWICDECGTLEGDDGHIRTAMPIKKFKNYKEFNLFFELCEVGSIEYEGKTVHFKDLKTYNEWLDMMKWSEWETTANFKDGKVVPNGTMTIGMENRKVTWEDCPTFEDFQKIFNLSLSFDFDIRGKMTGEYEFLKEYVEVN